MSRRDEALASLDSTDWSGAVVDNEPRTVNVVLSARVTADTADRFFAAAEARGLKPSAYLRELIEDATPPAEDETVTIRLADLHRAIDAAARRRAA